MIEFREVSKTYPNSTKPVVDKLSFEVPEGGICILIGPSGCGKTTTMKMVNRLIEPTYGEILIGGVANTRLDQTQLRRKIGYVIQEVGLFPHRTIAENIATVPHLLGWDRKRINERVEELLQLVNLDPTLYSSRYPAELSGGQQQRVGVARAMAADPPVMLMDEPFGAVDPLARERLQDEFLKIQERVRKTIVFVTHDIDEAIKMGDKIAILQEGGILAQYDTPERILTAPSSDFVASFVGMDRALKRLSLVHVKDVELQSEVSNGQELPRIDELTNLKDALSILVGAGADRGVVVSSANGGSGGNGTLKVLTLDSIKALFQNPHG